LIVEANEAGGDAESGGGLGALDVLREPLVLGPGPEVIDRENHLDFLR
jgi:hypothetical protein